MSRRQPQLPAIQTYLSNDEDSRIARQLASQSTFPEANRSHSQDHHSPLSLSAGTSMLLSAGDHTRDSMTQNLAALTRASSLESPASLPSSMGARHLDHVTRLGQDQAGALIVSSPRRARVLECPFNLLYCFKAFADTNYEEWIIHSLAHFRHVDPPTSNRCCFCEAAFDSHDGVSSWHKRMQHVFLHHRLGHSLSCAQPDFQLYTYLWNKHVINDADYRDIKGNSEDRSRHVRAYPTPPVSPNERSIATAHTSYTNSRRTRR